MAEMLLQDDGCRELLVRRAASGYGVGAESKILTNHL